MMQPTQLKVEKINSKNNLNLNPDLFLYKANV